MEQTDVNEVTPEMLEKLQEELGKVSGDLSQRILAFVFETKLPSVAQYTALVGAATGFATTWVAQEQDEDRRSVLAATLASSLINMVDEVLKAGAPNDGEEDRTSGKK